MQEKIHVCVFAKPPVAGEVKTRLQPFVSPAQAALLSEAFLRDTWKTVASLPWAMPVLAVTQPWDGNGLRPENVWLQGNGDLGERIERILRRALREAASVLAIGSDSPGLPARFYLDARRALASRDAVLGPTEDGGFYLLGLKRCPPELLRNLPWSVDTTFEATKGRLESHGFTVHILEPWFDVDRPRDLRRLFYLANGGEICVPQTANVFQRDAELSRKLVL